MSKVSVFTSFTGGTWRTTSLANVAIRLNQRMKRVAVLDFDYRDPNQQRRFAQYMPANARNKPGLYELMDVVARNCFVDLSAAMTTLTNDIDLINASTMFRPTPEMSVDGGPSHNEERFVELAQRTLPALLGLFGKRYDHILIDAPCGDNPVNRLLMLCADNVVFHVNQSESNLERGLPLVSLLLSKRRADGKGDFRFLPVAVNSTKHEHALNAAWISGSTTDGGRPVHGLGYVPRITKWYAENYNGAELPNYRWWAVPHYPYYAFRPEHFEAMRTPHVDHGEPAYFYNLLAEDLLR